MKYPLFLVSIILVLLLNPHSSCFADGAGRIAFVSTRDGGTEIYVMNFDGGDQRRLTHDLREKGEPAWSLDGRYLSYHGKDASGRTGIHVISVDGTSLRRLTDSNDMGAVWSPDERSMAFYSFERG